MLNFPTPSANLAADPTKGSLEKVSKRHKPTRDLSKEGRQGGEANVEYQFQTSKVGDGL